MTPWILMWSISTNILMVLVNFFGIQNSISSKNISGGHGNTMTDYEKWELRNWKTHERCVKKAVEQATDGVESEENGDGISSTRKWGRRGRGTQPKK